MMTFDDLRAKYPRLLRPTSHFMCHVGWVSILDPSRLARDLSVPADWRLVGYLCVGHPADEEQTPELERLGWEARAETLMSEVR